MLLNIYIHGGGIGKGASFHDLLLQEKEVRWQTLCKQSYAVMSTN